jgi:2-C-methyl-D-erythritol 4-phosphate cytidylyltransferase
MIEWSIDAFRACDSIAAIVVAVPPGLVDGGSMKAGEGKPALESREQAIGPAIEILAGGSTRAESVANAIAAVETELVAIHDAARPLLTPELVTELVAVLESDPEASGAIAAAPITDTVKRATLPADRSSPTFSSIETGKVGLAIETTLDRSTLWGAQTPQVFRTEGLREAIAAAPNHLDAATDEAMLLERAGGIVLIHPSGPGNLKVTTPLDLKVAELLLAERPGPGAPD